jgi:excisionase family DNA binding protein
MFQTRTVSVERAGEVLGLSRSSAYAAVRAGELPAIRVGRCWVVPIAKLESMLGEREGTLSTLDREGELTSQTSHAGVA